MRAVIKDIPGEDQSCEGEDSGDSVVDHSMHGWPAPMDKEPAFDSIIRGGPKTSQANVPVAPVNGLPPNISAMLQAVQDPAALQSILGQNVNTPPPTLKPEEAELYQSQVAAAAALAEKGDLPPPLHLPPPNFHQGSMVTTTGVTTTISTGTGHKVRGGEKTIEEKVSRQTTSGETKDEMTGEEEDSRDLASSGWRRGGAKLRIRASTPIPDR